MSELIPIAVGCSISTLLLLIEHLSLYPYTRLHFLARYVLGTAALGLGMLVWAALTDRLVAAVAFWAMAGCGGFTVVGAYWLRWQSEGSRSEADRKAFWAGQVAGFPPSEEQDGPPKRPHTRSN